MIGKGKYVVPRKSLVMSKSQLTYREAEDILKAAEMSKEEKSISFQLSKDTICDGYKELTHYMHLLTRIFLTEKIWEIVWSWRISRLGGGAFYREYDKYSEIAGEGRSHILIQEAMVAVNANAATYLIDKVIVYI